MDHVRHRAVGPDVLSAPQLLSKESKEFGPLGPDRLPPGNGDCLHADHRNQRHQGETRHPDSDPGMLAPEKGDHGDE